MSGRGGHLSHHQRNERLGCWPIHGVSPLPRGSRLIRKPCPNRVADRRLKQRGCRSASFAARHSASVGCFGFDLAVRRRSRHGSGGLPALRQSLQKASMRLLVALPMRFRPSGVCLPDSKWPPCILHLERGPSGPMTTRARQLPPALVRAPQAGAHAFLPTMIFRLKSPYCANGKRAKPSTYRVVTILRACFCWVRCHT